MQSSLTPQTFRPKCPNNRNDVQANRSWYGLAAAILGSALGFTREVTSDCAVTRGGSGETAHACPGRTSRLKPPRQAKPARGRGLSQPRVTAALVSINSTGGKRPGCSGCREGDVRRGEGKAWEDTAAGWVWGRGARGCGAMACGEEHLWGRVEGPQSSWTSPEPDCLAASCSSMLKADGEGSASPLERG